MEQEMEHPWTDLPEGTLTLMQAIGRINGWYAELDHQTRAQMNFNPGDIEYGAFACAHGAIAADGKYAVFPSAGVGFACFEAKLRSPAYCDMTIAEMVAEDMPANSVMCTRSICRWAGRKPTDIVGESL